MRLVEGPGDLEGVELAAASRVLVAAPDGADGWIAWPGHPAPGDGSSDDVLLQVGNAGQALSSALAGLGKALMPLPLVEEPLGDGRLVALAAPEDSRSAYWLVAPRPQWRQKAASSRLGVPQVGQGIMFCYFYQRSEK